MNSPLVNYTKISPNKNSPRRFKIDTITIHCTAGQTTVEAMGNMFSKVSRQASSNYGIGYDGRVGMYVEEKDRSWCSSSGANDHRAVTIEVSSDNFHPYAVTSKAYNTLIALCADICKRNGIDELKWKADKTLIGQIDKQNMTVHRWFSAKACPGDYLYGLHGAIADRVNNKLNPEFTRPEVEEPKLAKGNYVTVIKTYKVGSKTYGTTYAGGAFRVWYSKYKVMDVQGNRVVIGIGAITSAAVNISDVRRV